MRGRRIASFVLLTGVLVAVGYVVVANPRGSASIVVLAISALIALTSGALLFVENENTPGKQRHSNDHSRYKVIRLLIAVSTLASTVSPVLSSIVNSRESAEATKRLLTPFNETATDWIVFDVSYMVRDAGLRKKIQTEQARRDISDPPLSSRMMDLLSKARIPYHPGAASIVIGDRESARYSLPSALEPRDVSVEGDEVRLTYQFVPLSVETGRFLSTTEFEGETCVLHGELRINSTSWSVGMSLRGGIELTAGASRPLEVPRLVRSKIN